MTYSVASASMPPGFRTRAISRMVCPAPSTPPKCSIDDSEYAMSKVLSANSSCRPSIFMNARWSRRYGNGAYCSGLLSTIGSPSRAALILPVAFVHVGGDDLLHVIGQPVEHVFVAGADAQDVGVLAKHAEPPAAVQELGELVRLAVHRQLVVGQAEAAQQLQPLLVVPLGGIGQLAELSVAGDRAHAILELVRQREAADDVEPPFA